MNFLEIYGKIYGSWLGKLIGIRLGAPIEGWTGPEVRATYTPVRGYVTDYGQFAADDDANCPLFFVRGMEDHALDNVTAEAMGIIF